MPDLTSDERVRLALEYYEYLEPKELAVEFGNGVQCKNDILGATTMSINTNENVHSTSSILISMLSRNTTVACSISIPSTPNPTHVVITSFCEDRKCFTDIEGTVYRSWYVDGYFTINESHNYSEYFTVSSHFKSGDSVYCPIIGSGIYTLSEYNNIMTKIDTDNRTWLFSQNGSVSDKGCPVLYHTTEQNREKLSKLHGIEFCKVENYNNTVLELLKSGQCVICKVTNNKHRPIALLVAAHYKSDGTLYFEDINGWTYHSRNVVELESLPVIHGYTKN